jgi:phosphoribosylglycinamide formyltransferase-1
LYTDRRKEDEADMTGEKHRLAVLVSGRGSNLQAIMDACVDGRLDAEVAIVISDVEDAYALERARNAGIKAVRIPWKKGRKPEWEAEAVRLISQAGCELICLAGFMRIVGETLLSAFPDRIINIHPALLPSFPGLHAQEQAFDWGVKVSGCSVHFVTGDLDMGPIIVQRAVRVEEDDTAEALADRILEQEHMIYPEAIDLILSGRTRIEGRRVRILPKGR